MTITFDDAFIHSTMHRRHSERRAKPEAESERCSAQDDRAEMFLTFLMLNRSNEEYSNFVEELFLYHGIFHKLPTNL